jgi:hypothetical protein
VGDIWLVGESNPTQLVLSRQYVVEEQQRLAAIGEDLVAHFEDFEVLLS